MKILGLLVILAISPLTWAKEIKLPKTVYTPVFRDPGEVDLPVGPLWVDETPVTNKEFLEFIRERPEFGRSKISPLFADYGYLSHWQSDTSFAKAEADFPVTRVSWFAARKYCASKGKRLPTIAEWEVAGDAQNPKVEAEILHWYANPNSKLRAVGLSRANKFGLKDMHGLVWEWVDNFGEAIMSGDSRGGSPTDSLFCGGAALKAKDPTLYATFMRFAHRNSLAAKYASPNLGFRCVKEVGGSQ